MGACASRINEPNDDVPMPEAAPEPAAAAVEVEVSTEAKTEDEDKAEDTKEQPLVDISETPSEPTSASDALDELAPELKELKVDAPVEIEEEIPKDEVALKEEVKEEDEEPKKVAVENHPLMEEKPKN